MQSGLMDDVDAYAYADRCITLETGTLIFKDGYQLKHPPPDCPLAQKISWVESENRQLKTIVQLLKSKESIAKTERDLLAEETFDAMTFRNAYHMDLKDRLEEVSRALAQSVETREQLKENICLLELKVKELELQKASHMIVEHSKKKARRDPVSHDHDGDAYNDQEIVMEIK